VYTGSPQAIDGCATFFRRDRFSHVKKYEVCAFSILVVLGIISILILSGLHSLQVEFNKAAQSLTDAIIPTAQKKLALNRLVKVQPI
jgi:CCR4-NOT transcription complex subunit 6